MYNKKYENLESVIGPTFEEMNKDELMVSDGSGTEWITPFSQQTAKFTAWTQVYCAISASIASVSVVGYSVYTEFN